MVGSYGGGEGEEAGCFVADALVGTGDEDYFLFWRGIGGSWSSGHGGNEGDSVEAAEVAEAVVDTKILVVLDEVTLLPMPISPVPDLLLL